MEQPTETNQQSPSQAQSPRKYVLAEWVASLVIEEQGGYSFRDGAETAFASMLDTLFEQGSLDPKHELDGLIRFGAVLGERGFDALRSELARLIASDSRALDVLGLQPASMVKQLRRRMATVSGAQETLAAPVIGAAAPAGSKKLSSFLPPRALARPGPRPQGPRPNGRR